MFFIYSKGILILKFAYKFEIIGDNNMVNKYKDLERKVFRMQAFCVTMVLLGGGLLLMGFSSNNKQKFKEIDVERINIVEKDGSLKMVISNKERQHPGTMDGKYYKEREGQRAAGMIFFSEKGDEIGGLIFDGNTDKGQFGSLTFDKFRGDQTIQFLHGEDAEGNYFSGLKMNDQNMPLNDFMSKVEEIRKLPTKEEQEAAFQEMRDKGQMSASRLMLGKGRDKSAFIKLKDAKGKSRIEISVEANGTPKLNFLDENGKVVYSLPDDAKLGK
jgi:hypothetical protein